MKDVNGVWICTYDNNFNNSFMDISNILYFIIIQVCRYCIPQEYKLIMKMEYDIYRLKLNLSII